MDTAIKFAQRLSDWLAASPVLGRTKQQKQYAAAGVGFIFALLLKLLLGGVASFFTSIVLGFLVFKVTETRTNQSKEDVSRIADLGYSIRRQVKDEKMSKFSLTGVVVGKDEEKEWKQEFWHKETPGKPARFRQRSMRPYKPRRISNDGTSSSDGSVEEIKPEEVENHVDDVLCLEEPD